MGSIHRYSVVHTARAVSGALLAGALVAGVLFTGPARADEDDRPPLAQRQEAARLLDAAVLFGADTGFRADMRVANQGLAFPGDLPAPAVAELRDLEAKVQEKSKVPFRETLIDIYAATLTPEQLSQAADFMQSPDGQARAAFIQQQNTDPALVAAPAFRIDAPLRAALAEEAAKRGLVLPKEE